MNLKKYSSPFLRINLIFILFLRNSSISIFRGYLTPYNNSLKKNVIKSDNKDSKFNDKATAF